VYDYPQDVFETEVESIQTKMTEELTAKLLRTRCPEIVRELITSEFRTKVPPVQIKKVKINSVSVEPVNKDKLASLCKEEKFTILHTLIKQDLSSVLVDALPLLDDMTLLKMDSVLYKLLLC
jgi:hypothetical protein